MSDPVDFIMPMLREMRAENAAHHDKTHADFARMEKRIEKIEGSLVSFRQALTADTLMSKLVTGEFEERIEILKAKVRGTGIDEMSEALTSLGDAIKSTLGSAVQSVEVAYGELNIRAEASETIRVLTTLRDDPRFLFKNFTDLCGADYPAREKRFDVVWHLLSPKHNTRVRVTFEANETDPIPSGIPAFPAADWYEREIYDLYGVFFSGHPDLRRILTDYGFEGHPLRKDFPTTGFVEVRYDDEEKRVVYEPVKLVQEFRNFDFLSPWEGTDYVLPGDEKAKTN